jgi:hypothetical protein
MSDLKTHWSGFITALNKDLKPECTNSVNTSSEKGVSGFLDLDSGNNLAKYDAMQSGWVGIEATNKGLLNTKIIGTEFAPYNKNVR